MKPNPQEKALERFRHYLLMIPIDNGMSVNDEINFAKQCAKSECDEIISVVESSCYKQYWNAVKSELEAIK